MFIHIALKFKQPVKKKGNVINYSFILFGWYCNINPIEREYNIYYYSLRNDFLSVITAINNTQN